MLKFGERLCMDPDGVLRNTFSEDQYLRRQEDHKNELKFIKNLLTICKLRNNKEKLQLTC